MVSGPLNWYDHNADNPPWIEALAEVRRLAPREGWRYQHVQAIIVSIDQYAEAALGRALVVTGRITSPRLFECPAKSVRMLAVALQARRAFFLSWRCVEAYFIHAGVH
jgi:hypothetical protein